MEKMANWRVVFTVDFVDFRVGDAASAYAGGYPVVDNNALLAVWRTGAGDFAAALPAGGGEIPVGRGDYAGVEAGTGSAIVWAK